MPTTIEEVARQSGVSTATVSRALRGLPNVAPSTRERVLKVAEDLNYSIDSQASRLAMGRTMTVGMVMPLADQWFYKKVATAAETMLFEQGYDVLRYSINSIDNQNQIIRQLATSHRVDGIIFVTITLSDEDIMILLKSDVEVVTVETQTEHFSSVTTDNVTAAAKATRHLVKLGHKDIGIIIGLPDDPLHFAIPLERQEGYWRVLGEYGHKIRPELSIAGNFSANGAAAAMAKLLSLKEPPTAVFTLSDEMAIGAIKTIRDAGLQVPEDISVIGFDDHDLAEHVDLTTVRQPVADYGSTATRLLLEHMNSREHAPPTHVQFPTELIVRSTTAPCCSSNHR